MRRTSPRSLTLRVGRSPAARLGESGYDGRDRFEGQCLFRLRAAGQRQVMILAGTPGPNLVVIMSAARVARGTRYLHCPQGMARIGQVGNHAITRSQRGAVIGIGGATVNCSAVTARGNAAA